jgi:hypothetical protein
MFLYFLFLGVYKRININLPEKMYKRKTYMEYNYDPPLTEVGKCQARLTGNFISLSSLKVYLTYACASTFVLFDRSL